MWKIAGVVLGAIVFVLIMIDAGETVGRILEWAGERYWPRRPSVVGPDALLGQLAKVIGPFQPAKGGYLVGQVRLHGEIWRARLDRHADVLQPSSPMVRVTDVDGLTLIVCELEPSRNSELTMMDRP